MLSSFGEMVKELRKKLKLTQKQLADGICSVKQIKRIENNECEPSIYILHKLSSKLNVDLNEHYKRKYINGSAKAIEFSNEIVEAVVEKNLKKLKKMINILEKNEEFQSGSNLALLYFAKSFYLFNNSKKYDKIILLCEQGIKSERPEFTLNNCGQTFYSSFGYSMLSIIGYCYKELNDYDKCKKIFFYIIASVEDFYFSGSYQNYESMNFISMLYHNTLFELGKLYYSKNSYDDAFLYINKAIKFSFEKNLAKLLPELFEMKYLILYKMGKFNEALTEYRCAKNLYISAGFLNLAVVMESTMKAEFPEIAELEEG